MNKQKKTRDNLKITSRLEDYSQWYLDIIDAAGLAEYGPVKGTMVIKPYGYAIWENIQKTLDGEFKKVGIENAYFPLLIPEKLLKKEAKHVEGFSPEVAVVTYAGGKRLQEALVIRPTSETIIYETFSKWIRTHKNLPILINQWANVVRWEMRPRFFLRTTEFLWQEGHTAHANEKEADDRALIMLDIYKKFAENFLAVPVITGTKSESEKFAGAFKTYSLEAMMQDGKALQFATSHNLGQNFSKAFDLQFTTEDGASQYVWQTSWGLSTRTIGGLIMVHSDDRGLILPPRVSPIQIVIVPIWPDNKSKSHVMEKAEIIFKKISDGDRIRVKLDDRDIRPGGKYYEWEKKGVPLRIEIGPKDILKQTLIFVRRDTGEKNIIDEVNLVNEVENYLSKIQDSLLQNAKERMAKKTVKVNQWAEFVVAIKNGNFVLAHWSGETDVEQKIKKEVGATIRCVPFNQPEEIGKCIYSGKPSKERVLFAKAY